MPDDHRKTKGKERGNGGGREHAALELPTVRVALEARRPRLAGRLVGLLPTGWVELKDTSGNVDSCRR